MRLCEEQPEGKIKVSDFYPVPTVVPISRAVSALQKRSFVEFTTHPHCGMATYLFIDKGEITPITRYGNVEELMDTMDKVYEEATKGHEKRAKLRMLSATRHVKFGFLTKYIWPVLKTGEYRNLGELHMKMMLVSAMHFMDPYNFDLDRVQRCCIHYAVPDGRIIPFCTMNSIHRPNVEKGLGVPIDEWKKKHKTEITAIA